MNNDEIYFLSQPLITEDGLINEACLNELNQALEPAASEAKLRMQRDPEWNSPVMTFKNHILGSFACSAVRLCPYDCPENLETVIKYLGACLKREVNWEKGGYAYLSLNNIFKLLNKILMDGTIAEFEAWNVSKNNQTNNKKQGTVFVNGGSTLSPDDDFIDLHALILEVCILIRNDRREFDRSLKDFNERYKESQDQSGNTESSKLK